MKFLISWGGRQAIALLIFAILIGILFGKLEKRINIPHFGLIVEIGFIGAILLFYLIAHDIGFNLADAF